MSAGADSVGTLARGLDVLELFSPDRAELTQKEISTQLGLPLPTVHRLTKVLAERGYLARDERTRRLRLGLAAARLVRGLQLPDAVREHLRQMAEETGETVSLATLHGGEVVYLASETGGRLLTSRATVGLRLPSYCTALGKCLLSQLPDAEARRAVGREPYPALTDRTLTRWEDLHTALEQVRGTGVAVSEGEYEQGLHAFAVPVEWHGADAPLAIGVSLPGPRDTPDMRADLVDRLRAA
jgi:IclR family transcriptional regulator, acetate operon repressor